LNRYQKDIDLKITWDDENILAVFCPVADFLGFAFGQRRMQSLLLGADQSASLEFIYRNSTVGNKLPIEFNITIYYSFQKRDTVREGKFYTYWNKKLMSEIGNPHLFLDHQGKGHYVGTLLQSQGLLAGMTYFFEGDDFDGNRRQAEGTRDGFRRLF